MPLMETVAALCQRLVQIPSFSGREGPAASAVADAMSSLGYADVQVDAYGSVIGRRRGSAPGPRVLFDAHLDTVAPAGPGRWTRDPWSGSIEDGRLWGLGAADVKGALAAMLAGLAEIPAGRFAGEILLSASVCEENLTAAALDRVLDRYPADYVVVGEPTELRLGIAQKGRLDVLIHATGRSAHTSQPELGENAVYKMVEAIQRLRGLPRMSDPDLGPSVLELVEITSEPLPGAAHVPHGCRARYVARTLPPEPPAATLARLRAALAGLEGIELSLDPAAQTCYTGAVLSHDGSLPGWRIPVQTRWLAGMQHALARTGLPTATFAAPFGCNASASAGRRGLPTVIYGPGSLAQAHAVDEWIALDQLAAAARAYPALALAGLAA